MPFSMPFLGFPGAAVGVVRIILADLRKAPIANKHPLPRLIHLDAVQPGGWSGAAIAGFFSFSHGALFAIDSRHHRSLRTSKDHPPRRSLQRSSHHHRNGIANHRAAFFHHNHRAVIQVAYALSRFFPLLENF
jgi:hypothetical protein